MLRIVATFSIFFASLAPAFSQAGQLPANTYVGNPTTSRAASQSVLFPSCADSGGNHLNYVNGTGVTCGTGGSPNARTLLTGTQTYFVNGNSGSTAACGPTGAATCVAGNDSNNCLTAATACLTTQHVITLIQNGVDLAYRNNIVSLAHNAGTQNYAFTCSEPFVGGFLTIQGDTTNIASVVVTAPNGGTGMFINAGCQAVIDSITFADAGSAARAVYAREGAVVDLKNFAVNAFSVGGVHIVAENNSTINFTGACTINGGAGAFVQAILYSKIDFGGQSCNVTTPITYSYTAQAIYGSFANMKAASFTGSAITNTVTRALLNGGAASLTTAGPVSCNTAFGGSIACQITQGAQTDFGDALTTPWPVTSGGTGAATFAAHGVPVGNGTGALNIVGPCTTNQIIIYSSGSGSDPACGVARSTIGSSTSGTLAQNTTNYVGNQNNFQATQISSPTVSIGGTIRNLYWNAGNTPAGGQTYIATVMTGTYAQAVAGTLAASGVTCTISNPAVQCSDTSNSVAIAAGSVWAIKIVSSATSGSMVGASWALEFDNP